MSTHRTREAAEAAVATEARRLRRRPGCESTRIELFRDVVSDDEAADAWTAEVKGDRMTAIDRSGARFWPANPRVSTARGLRRAIAANRGTWAG